ncbi:MAG: hypothetical protein DWI67_05810 [Chloroflexi bacterium]|nr:MAG: hypothetical protein DWI67_05810 [Chloroflexota bacterium]
MQRGPACAAGMQRSRQRPWNLRRQIFGGAEVNLAHCNRMRRTVPSGISPSACQLQRLNKFSCLRRATPPSAWINKNV